MDGFEIDLLPVTSGEHSGDCIAFRYGDLQAGGDKQTVVVVDGGYGKNAADMKAHLKKYYNCTTKEGKVRIDLMIVTHTDLDHVGGLAKLAEDDEIEILNLWTHVPQEEMTKGWFADGRSTTSSVRDRLDDAFDQLSKLLENAKNAKRWATDCDWHLNGAEFTNLSPDPVFFKKCIANSGKANLKPNEKVDAMKYPVSSAKDEVEDEDYVPGHIQWDDSEGTSAINESSMVFLFEYNGIRALFCGDAGKEAMENAIEQAKAQNKSLKGLSFIKQPHHGSRKNVNPTIMGQLSAKYSFISCTTKDEGHHPSKRLVNMLNEKGYKIYSTSGKTLHWGKNAPDRNWIDAKQLTSFNKIEKRKTEKK